MNEPGDAARALEKATGHRFRDPQLAETSLAHPSYAHEIDGSRGNERLEFVGDAVLDLVVARLLYERRPSWSEGKLTRLRAALVNKASLAERARSLGLRELVRLGRTEQREGRDKESILANCFEAVIGAIYLDGGLEAAERVIGRSLGEALDRDHAPRDPKTAFQEWAHREHQTTPRYRTLSDTGVENDADRFTVEVCVGKECFGEGVGRTKRAAESAAAAAGLSRAGAAR